MANHSPTRQRRGLRSGEFRYKYKYDADWQVRAPFQGAVLTDTTFSADIYIREHDGNTQLRIRLIGLRYEGTCTYMSGPWMNWILTLKDGEREEHPDRGVTFQGKLVEEARDTYAAKDGRYEIEIDPPETES